MVQTGPAQAQSRTTFCQVPEKSNNVWNSLICNTWLQLKPVGLKRSGRLKDRGTKEREGGVRREGIHGVPTPFKALRGRHRRASINMPMHTQACTHAHASRSWSARWLCKEHRRKGVAGKARRETWEHRLLYCHFPAEKERKKWEAKERRWSLSQAEFPTRAPQVVCAQLGHVQTPPPKKGKKLEERVHKYFGTNLIRNLGQVTLGVKIPLSSVG